MDDITHPDEFLGFGIGERVAAPWQITSALKTWSNESDRIKVIEYARTHEDRPLHAVFISSPNNIKNLEAIKTNEEGNSEIERLVPPALDRSDWGNDIFYDRSDIYDSWFNLTGITEFSNGRKAIINGEILRLNERVRGFTVKKITENKVMLKRNQYHVTLNLVQ